MQKNIDLRILARDIRKKLLFMHYKAGTSHIGSAFSIVEILIMLYFRILNIDSKEPDDANRDRFILSKGHAVSALYATLAKKGFFDEEILDKYCIDNGILPGHPDRFSVPGIESSTGSLGHGLPIGVGLAFAGKKDKKIYWGYFYKGNGNIRIISKLPIEWLAQLDRD